MGEKKGKARIALCEVVVKDAKHCSPECRCMKVGFCWRGFRNHGVSASELSSDRGGLLRTPECVQAERAARRLARGKD